MLKLYKYEADVGRHRGRICGAFVVDERGEELLQELMKSRQRVSFGEVLGKYSDVSGWLDASELELLCSMDDEIHTVLHAFGKGFGVDPWVVLSGYCPITCEGLYEVLRRWRDVLRARRAEGSWPVPRAA